MAIDLQNIQKTIGYEFNNEDLLQQAFVRRSYSEENGGQNNEVLEFIGDKALDLAVIRIMMEEFGEITENKQWSEFKLRNPRYFNTKLKEGKFTDIKKDLVEKKALANSMDKLGFHTQLIMGHGDIIQNIQYQDSVKEDLFEAIIGAVALDSEWDMDEITDVVRRMIDFEGYFENEMNDVSNYVGKVQEWSQQNDYGLPAYEYKWVDNKDLFKCRVTIDGTDIQIIGYGTSEAKGRMDAAKNLYNYLVKNDLIKNEYESAVGEPNYVRAIAQVNELVQKKLLSEPSYTFEQDYDDDGSSIWTCQMDLDDIDYPIINSSNGKKDAKKKCCYELLCDLMGYEYDID